MPDLMPRRIAKTSTYGFAVCLTAQVAVFVGSVLGLGANHHHSLHVMAFGLAMTGSVVFGLAALLARGQIAIARAFTAGVQVGRAQHAPHPVRLRKVPGGLRSVD